MKRAWQPRCPLAAGTQPPLQLCLLIAVAWVARNPPPHGFVAHLHAAAPHQRHVLVARRSDLKSGNTPQPRNCRKGHLVSFQNIPYEILDCLHGYTESAVTLKLRDLGTGAVSMKRFRDDATLEQIGCIQKTAIYTHFDEVAETYVFLDSETFEEVNVSAAIVGDMSAYLVDGMEVDLSMYRGKTIQFGLNTNWVAEVKSFTMKNSPTRGSGLNKANLRGRYARLSNGKSVHVPRYVQIGDKVRVDPKTGDYVKRL